MQKAWKPVARAAMHVTLRFFGHATDEQTAALRAFTRALAPLPAIPVVARKVTGFPDERRSRVLVVALEDDGALRALAAAAEREAVRLGFDGEDRELRPHLTLARFREAVDVRRIVGEPVALPEVSVVQVALYDSKTLPEGPEYSLLERVT